MARTKDGDTYYGDADHSADQPLPPDPAPVPPDEAARLVELRAANMAGKLTDAEREEMAKLSAAESEAAGHVVAEPAAAVHPILALHDEVLGVLRDVIELLPQLGSLRPRVAQMRDRMRLLIDPPVDGPKP